MSFADSSAAELHTRCSLPQIEYDIPLIHEFVKKGPFHQSRLFVISGAAQSYKTSIAVELLRSFTMFDSLSCEAIWLDCDFKFPLDLLKARNVNLHKLQVAKCRSSEEILFNLLAIEHEILYGDQNNNAPIRAIVIDSINSSFWIDAPMNKMRWKLQSICERFVSHHAITTIVVMADLGDFEMWDRFETTPVMKLRCFQREPGKGHLAFGTFADSFSVREDRSFEWGKRKLIQDAVETRNGENTNGEEGRNEEFRNENEIE